MQGIVNDNSFGRIEAQDHRSGCMPLLSSLGVISKKMDDRVLSLTPSELAFSLRGIVDEPSVKAAAKRLKLLKNHIKLSRQKLDPKTQNIQSPYIRELDREGFKNVDVQQLADPRLSNHFCEFKKAIGGVAGRAKASNNDPETELIGSVNRATEAGVTGQILKAKAFSKKLSDCTSFWRGSSSQNYLDLEEAVEKYRALQERIQKRMAQMKKKAAAGDASPETLYGQYVTAFDMNKMKKCLKTVKEAADKYANTKSAELQAAGKSPDNDKYIKHRIETAQEISRFAEEGLSVSEEEKEALAANDRRATEQFARRRSAETVAQAQKRNQAVQNGPAHQAEAGPFPQ